MLKDPISDLDDSTYAIFQQMEEKRGPIKGLYRYLFHHPQLANKVVSLGEELRFHSCLPEEVRVFTTLVIAQRYQAKWIWDTHSPFLDTNLSEQIAEEKPFEESPFKEINSLVEHFFAQKQIPHEAYLIHKYSTKGYLELVMICAFYQMMIFSTFALGVKPQSSCAKKKN